MEKLIDKLVDKSVEVYANKLEKFMVDCLKKETGKTYFKMDDETRYGYDYYEEYGRYHDRFHFVGLKCVNKTFRTLGELLEGIKNKEVVLFEFATHKNSGVVNLTSGYDTYEVEKFKKESKIKELPILTLADNRKGKDVYFKLYPNLEEKLIHFVNNIALNSLKHRMNSIKEGIDSNEKEMNEEIQKIKLEYQKRLLEDNEEYAKLEKDYETKREKVKTILKNSEAKKQQAEGLEK